MPHGEMGNDQLVFVEITLSLRASAHTGVAIPPLEGKCIDNCPIGRGTLRFLVVIVTRFHSTGGLPRQCAHWLAMTAKTYKQQFAVARMEEGAESGAAKNFEKGVDFGGEERYNV